ncbi:MAG: hypothetical protein ABIU30_02120 [Ferruginibacter sp.]
MVSTPVYKTSLHQMASAQEFMHDVLNNVYPELFTQINSIVSAIELIQTDHSNSLLVPLAKKISNEMDGLYSMEKEVLFPFITTLAADNQKSESCKLFKDTKVHYTAMLRYINELKICLTICNSQDCSPAVLSAIKESVAVFEQQIIFLQVTKDKYLFAQFKSCSGCKAIVS